MENSKPSQALRVLEYIRQFGSIDQIQALRDLGVIRSASRIFDLRKQGYDIVGEREAVVNRHEEITYIKRYFEGGKPDVGCEMDQDHN